MLIETVVWLSLTYRTFCGHFGHLKHDQPPVAIVCITKQTVPNRINIKGTNQAMLGAYEKKLKYLRVLLTADIVSVVPGITI